MTKEDRFLFTNKVDANEVYNTINYKDAFNHIRALADMEWNGKITLFHFRERIDDIITVISKKEKDGKAKTEFPRATGSSKGKT